MLLPCLSTINKIRKDSRARMTVECCTSFNPVYPDKSRCGMLNFCNVCLVQGMSTLIASFALCAILFCSAVCRRLYPLLYHHILLGVIVMVVFSYRSYMPTLPNSPTEYNISQTGRKYTQIIFNFSFINQPISPLHCI
jgi:hypothetical protein